MPRVLLTPEQRLANKRECNRRWAVANPEKVRASRSKYDAANKEKIAAYKARAKKADPEKFRARRLAWEAKNHDKVKARSANRYQKDPIAFRQAMAEWKDKNPERYAEIRAAYRRSDSFVCRRRAYAKKRHKENIQARLATLLRNRIVKAVKRSAMPASVLQLVGCSLPELVMHIERQFAVGMAWSNHGSWHIDHVRPLSSFDLTDPAQIGSACHYTNLQPLWAHDNRSKGKRLAQEKSR